ncbi:MAG: hypothetical protein AABX24_02155 [Nanoarchaeota archaeon]
MKLTKLTKTERLILFSFSQFYSSINQQLVTKPLRLETSKITFIELILQSKIITKQERALYKNLESLEDKRLIEYDNRVIKFTDSGLNMVQKIDREINQFVDIKDYFKEIKKTKRKLQTVINN